MQEDLSELVEKEAYLQERLRRLGEQFSMLKTRGGITDEGWQQYVEYRSLRRRGMGSYSARVDVFGRHPTGEDGFWPGQVAEDDNPLPLWFSLYWQTDNELDKVKDQIQRRREPSFWVREPRQYWDAQQ